MAAMVPLDRTYGSRKAAMDAMRYAVVEATGHGISVDSKASGKKRVVVYCPSLFKVPLNQGKGKKVCVLHDTDRLDGFTCEQLPNEKTGVFAKRRVAAAEAFAKTKGFCGFKAVLNKIKVNVAHDTVGDVSNSLYVWKWKEMNDGKNYCPHDESCCHMTKLTGTLLRTAMKKKIHANMHMPGKQAKAAMTGAGTGITEANLPSQSSMYRAQYLIKNEELEWYNENWGRLETFLNELGEMNPTWTVTLEKDDDNRFKRLFVGIGSNIKVLQHAGLDVYALDSCHVKHIIAHGLQLHILVSYQGANRVVILAISVDTTESGASYTFFGQQCVALGIKDLFDIDRNIVPSLPVLFSDGMKGINEAIEIWGETVHHAHCVRHLAGSARDALKRQRAAALAYNRSHTAQRKVPDASLADAQVFALCRASNKRDFRKQMNAITGSNKAAALYLQQKETKRFSQFAMMNMKPRSVHCHGRVTSQAVEGTNGVLVQQRKEHPYRMVTEIIAYAADQFYKHQTETQKWVQRGNTLTPYASKLFASQKSLATSNHAYTVRALGSDRYQVTDTLSAGRTSYTVCIDKNSPSCSPCNFFSQHLIPCRHMLLCIGTYDPELFTERRQEFIDNFFHPSFLVKNLGRAYEDGVFNMPSAPTGRPMPKVISLTSSDDDDDDEEEELMLPPVGYGLDDYKKKKRAGRPRTKRIRSRGAQGNDGARLRLAKLQKRSAGVRKSRGSAEKGRIALTNLELH